MGTYWIGSPKRRQYDGGMAFMPQHDGDVGNRLNLWRGFGVKAIKPDGKSGAEGCRNFSTSCATSSAAATRSTSIICCKREATILQKRIRSEVALGLQTKEEGCGKGFYEATMGRLLGNHAMQITNPKHIIGNFNPHLETLLRLTADEALFVGNPRTPQRPVRTDHRTDADNRAEGLRRLHGRQLSEPVDPQQRRPLPAGQRHGAAVLHPDRVGCAQAGHRHTSPGCRQNSTTAATRRCSITCCTRSTSRTSTSARCRRRKALRQQRDHSLPPLEAWWCELLETGTLAGSRSGGAAPGGQQQLSAHDRDRDQVRATAAHITQIRTSISRDFLIRQGRSSPASRTYTNDHRLGRFLSEMGCDNTKKVLRRQGWSFPPLKDCRTEWEKRYPGWKWRNPDLAEWQAEADDLAEIEETGAAKQEAFTNALRTLQQEKEEREEEARKKRWAADQKIIDEVARRDQEEKARLEREFIGPRQPPQRRRLGDPPKIRF